MNKKTGIVMSHTDKEIILLGKDGLFYRQPLPQNIPLIGEEITFTINTSNNNDTNTLHKQHNLGFFKGKMRVMSMVASILLILLIGSMLIPLTPSAAYMVVVDINPTLEIYLDKEDRVTKVIPMNEEAKTVMDHHSFKGMRLSETLQVLSDKAKTAGYINSEESQIIATIITWKDDYSEEQLEVKVTEELNKVTLSTPIYVFTADRQTLSKANEANLTISKYQVAQALEKKGVEISWSEVKTESIDELLAKQTLDKESFFTQLNESQKENRHRAEPTSTKLGEKSSQKEEHKGKNKTKKLDNKREQEIIKAEKEREKQIEKERKELEKEQEKIRKELEKEKEKQRREQQKELDKKAHEKEKESEKEKREKEKKEREKELEKVKKELEKIKKEQEKLKKEREKEREKQLKEAEKEKREREKEKKKSKKDKDKDKDKKDKDKHDQKGNNSGKNKGNNER